MAQTWFTIQPFEMVEGRRPALFEAFDRLQCRIKNAFDDTSEAVTAAIFGISGAVNTYAELPDPTALEPKTIYIVRQKAGSPSGNGLYWVQVVGGINQWAFLDALNMQDASEVEYDNTVSAIPATNVQDAIDWLKEHGGGSGTSYKIFVKTIDATDIANKWFVLPSAPITETDNIMSIRNAPSMTYGLDYAVNIADSRVMWNGLGIDGIIEVGDVVTIMYKES